jgi:hypothetical protein
MIPRTLTCATLALALGLGPVAAQTPPAGPAPWTPAAIASAVASCRATIIEGEAHEYLTRNQLAPEQLPADFRTRILPIIEPLLKTCDCTIAALSREVPYADFQASTAQVQQRTRELLARGGACAAPSDP